MQLRQSLGGLQPDLKHRIYRQEFALALRLLQPGSQAAARAVLHHQDQRLAVALEVVHPYDIRVVEHRPELSFELEAVFVGSELGAAQTRGVFPQQLQGAWGVELQVGGVVDLGERAAAHVGFDPIFVEEDVAGLVGH